MRNRTGEIQYLRDDDPAEQMTCLFLSALDLDFQVQLEGHAKPIEAREQRRPMDAHGPQILQKLDSEIPAYFEFSDDRAVRYLMEHHAHQGHTECRLMKQLA